MDFSLHPIRSTFRIIGALFILLMNWVFLGDYWIGMSGLLAFVFALIPGVIYLYKRRVSLIASVFILGLAAIVTPYALEAFDERGVNGDTIRHVIALTIGFGIFFAAFIFIVIFQIKKRRKKIGGSTVINPKSPQQKRSKRATYSHGIPFGHDDVKDDSYSYERMRQKGRRPNSSCCEYLKEFELGYYDHGMSQQCAILGSQMTYDEARRRCYYSEDYERCPVWIRQKKGLWQGKYAGKGTSPSSYCCKFLKEYPSGYYESYSHRCEAVEMELPHDEARQKCYYSSDFEKCPIWQMNH